MSRSILVALAFLLTASPSMASEKWPAVLAEYVGAELPTDGTECLICHTSKNGEKVTATTLVARSLRTLGLGGTTSSLEGALDKAGDVDSDGDGVTDFEEIANGRDPNTPELNSGDGGLVAGVAPASVPVFETGCAMAHGDQSANSVAAAAVISGLLASLLRSRQRDPSATPG